MTGTTPRCRQVRWLVSCLLAATFLPLTGCGSDSQEQAAAKEPDTHEKMVDDMITTVKEMGKVLGGIKSADDATAAANQIESLAEEMQAIGERAEKLGEASEVDKRKLQAKGMELMAPLMMTALKLETLQQDPEIGPIIGDVLSKFKSAMESAN